MIKKIILSVLLFTSMLFVSSIQTYAITNLEDTAPFNYVAGTNTLHFLSSHFFTIPSNPEDLQFYIPRSSYADSGMTGGSSIYNGIAFYDSNYNLMELLDLATLDWFIDHWYDNFDGTMTIPLLNTPFETAGYKYFKLILIQDYSGVATSNYINWFNARFTFTFSDNPEDLIVNTGSVNILYIVDGGIWYKIGGSTNNIPDKPINPEKNNFLFKGWEDVNGVIFDFTTPLPVGTTGTYILRASWNLAWGTGQTTEFEDNTPPFLTNSLDTIGFNTVIGKTIVYFILMLLITFILIYYKLGTFLVIMVNVIIFGVFVFFGWLPMYMVIILGLTYLIGLFATIKGGI